MIAAYTKFRMIYFGFVHYIYNTRMSASHNKCCLIFCNNQVLFVRKIISPILVV